MNIKTPTNNEKVNWNTFKELNNYFNDNYSIRDTVEHYEKLKKKKSERYNKSDNK